MDINIEARITELAEEAKKLISENFAKPPNEAVQKRFREIKEEIHRYGFALTWDAKLNSNNPTALDAEVQLWKPKKNLTPEEQTLYDNWFKSVNEITA